VRVGGRVGRDSGLLIAANGATAVSQAIVAILAARVLPADEFGRYAIGLGVAALSIAASDGGVGVVATRELAQGLVHPLQVARHALSVRIGLALVVTAIGIALSSVVYDSPSTVEAIRVGLVIGALGAVNALGRSIFAGIGELRHEAVIQLGERLALLVLSLAALDGGSAVGLLLMALLARTLGLVARAVVLGRAPMLRSPRAAPLAWRGFVVSAAPLGLAVILSTVYFQIDVLMVAALVDEGGAGVYQAAVSILILAYLIPESISVALVPAFSRAVVSTAAELQPLLKRASHDLTVLGTGAALVLITLGPLIASVLYPTMPESARLVQILAFACAFRFTTYVLSALMPSVGQGRNRLIAAGVASVFNVAVNLVVIPPFGASGAAAVTVATELLLLVTYLATLPTEVAALQRRPVVLAVASGVALALLAGITTVATGLGIVGLAVAVATWEVAATIRHVERPSRTGARLMTQTAATLGWRA
jgi:O-antigen/teichoic acid export membrane protein